jgi:sugar transferase (PEP-CTERM/EpsH1 system associated)
VKVAYLCHRIPYPPNKGDKIRAFHQLRALAAAGHDVDLFTLIDDPADLKQQDAMRQYCREIETARINPRLQKLRSLPYLVTSTALTLPYFHSPELATKVRNAFSRTAYDRIVVYCSAMFQYIEHIDGVPVITDLVDVDSDKWKQYGTHARWPLNAVYRREGYRLEEYEKKVCSESSSVVVTTDREADLVRSMCPTANIHTIANGVDTKFFDRTVDGRVPCEPSIVFTGDMGYFPNEQAVRFFALEVLPTIRRAIPGIRFLIVGRNPSAEVLRLGGDPGIEVTGFVPDVRTYLARAQAAVAPFLIAAGIQNKILEAMAFSLPVVATHRAAQGLKRPVADVVSTAETAAGLAEKVITLLSDREYARSVGAESRRRVTLHYDWDTCLSQLLNVIERPGGTPFQVKTVSTTS